MDSALRRGGKDMQVEHKKTMERLDLIKKRIQDLQKQSAEDFEAVTDMARMRFDYQNSQLEGLLRLCDHSLKLQKPKLEPKGA